MDRHLRGAGVPRVRRSPRLVGARAHHHLRAARDQPEDASAYVRQTLPKELWGLRWYADDQAEAWGALRLAGAPMLVGIRDGRVEWGISGALSDPAKLRGLVRSWLDE